MPLINVKLIEGVFSELQKKQIAKSLTDGLVQVGGEAVRAGDALPLPPPLVLVANDQEWSARAVETVLTGAGYEVFRAYTGTQALARAEELRPDVCLLDVQMPGLTGVELAARLSAVGVLGPLVPLILWLRALGAQRGAPAVDRRATRPRQRARAPPPRSRRCDRVRKHHGP
mgnify:CR=1 FL=1